jgi:hypothetical protein
MFGLLASFGLFFVLICYGLGSALWKGFSTRQPLYILGSLLFFGGLLNFLIFWHLAVYLGGDAGQRQSFGWQILSGESWELHRSF